jgi:chromosome segregation protein
VRERLGVLHAESSALHARAEAVQRDLAVGAERLAALDQRAADLDRGQHELDLRCEELVREQAAIAGRLEASMEYLAGQRAAVAACEEQLAAREDQRRAAQRALEAAQRAELEAGAAIAERRQRAGQLARHRERLAHEHAGHAAALSAAEAGLAAQRASLAAAEERATAAEQARAAALEAAQRAREHLDALRAERARADEVLAQAQRALADAEARLETLSRLQRSYAGAFAGVRAAMQWAEANQRAGFALVSSLIRTPPHLETALEVALGSRLQHIVVERWSDAEEAIAALKHGGQGRATFLPLDTIRPPAGDRRPPTGDGVFGIAAELVEYAERYASVIWMLLGRTLVVRDLPVARQVLATLRRSAASSASGWTIVTLAGDQVSSGGAVTGGAQIREGGTLRREREVRELPRQIDAQRQAVATALEGRAALDERIAAARRAREEAEAAQHQAIQVHEAARSAHEQARRAVERAEADLAWQRRRHAQAAAELADLEAQAAALHDELDALTARWHDAHAQLSQLREEAQARAADEQDVQRHLADLRAALAAAEGETRADRALLQACEQNLARLDEQRTSAAQRRAELAQERAQQEAQVHALGTEHAALLARIDELRAQIDPAEAELMALETNLSELERHESEATAALLESESAHGRAAVETQRAQDQLDTLRARAAADDIDITTLPTDDAAVDPTEAERLDAAIQTLKTKIQRLGLVNPLALEEYEQEAAHHTFLTAQLDDLRRAESALRELIAELDAAMQARFETTFHAVAAEFARSFTRLFGGGQAQLLLTHTNGLGASTDGIERVGVDIVARPPGKRQQTLSLLSGGERSLTAAALLFAILRVHPSPFCILDEVDAALDEANVGRFREVLVDLSRQTQFVLITHNRGTIEAADTLYGVSLDEDGVSKVLSLRMEQLVE